MLQLLGAVPPDPCIWDLLFQYRNPLLKILVTPLPNKHEVCEVVSGESNDGIN